MHVIRYIFLLWIILSLHAFSQEKDSLLIAGNYKVKIDSIRIKGNEKTKDFIILRELTFKEGDTLSTASAEYNRDRVYSTSLFGIVEIIPYKFSSYTAAYIIVEESWYIWPIPTASLKDNDWKKLSYGMDLSIKNLFGYNERVHAKFTAGFDPSYYLYYSNPVLGYSKKYLFAAELGYSKIQNRSKKADTLTGHSFDQKFISGGITIGQRISLFDIVSISAGYTYIETPFYIKHISASDSRIDHIPFIGLSYSHDTRDLAQFAKRGWLLSGNLMWKGLALNGVTYEILNADLRGYTELFHDVFGKSRFAFRNIIGGNVPYYDYSFLGYGERVRGNTNKTLEAENYYLFSFETFTPLIKEMRLSFEWVPLLPKSLLVYRVALYAQAFADAGMVYNYGESVGFKKTQRGYGAGLTFLVLPYDMLRVEFAVNEFRNSELLVELGISF